MEVDNIIPNEMEQSVSVDPQNNDQHMDSGACLICRGPAENPINLCSIGHEEFCSSCWAGYIDSIVQSAYMGTCPCIYCPSESHQKQKKKKLVPYEAWQHVVPNETTKKFGSLANSLLAFLCGGCHALKSLDVGFDSSGSSAQRIRTVLGSDASQPNKTTEFEELMRSFQQGDIPVDEAYSRMMGTFFPDLVSLPDPEAWETFLHVLKQMSDPERRANFHLRYLRDRPRIKTLCCNREHCFTCKTKDFHEGKSCLEHMATLDHSVVSCPSCGISLAKGDGCNTITCVCGKQFSWTAEKENTDRCRVFLSQYPDDTSSACAKVLCESVDNNELIRAKAWQTRNRFVVSAKLREWLKSHYPHCTTQCSLVLPVEGQPEGVREAMELWRQAHTKEVEIRRKENELALRSIFLTLYPVEEERPAAAHRLISGSRIRGSAKTVDPKLAESASKWVETNKERYTKGIEDMEEKAAKQFLFLFGSRPVNAIQPSQTAFPCAMEWCRTISNNDLTYTNDNTTVERVGSVSCYPAAFASLVADRCMFKIQVDAAPRSSNWLTFGIARRGMAPSSSDGVGRTTNSWGLSDDRSSSAARAILASSGQEMSTCRKLEVGDVLCAVVDTIDGWCEISLNDTEFVHRFTIPSGSMDEYTFAMTFANDHRVSIIYEPTVVANGSPSKAMEGKVDDRTMQQQQRSLTCLNTEQSVMFNNMRKLIKSVLMEDEGTDGGLISSGPSQSLKDSRLFEDGSAWLKKSGGSVVKAQARFETLRPTLDQLLGMKKSGDVHGNIFTSSNKVEEDFSTISWNSIMEAVSWYRVNRERIRQELRADLAYTFSVSHGDDAPFLAAMTLYEYHNRRTNKSEIEAPMAFMQFFQEEMNDWYEADSRSREPMIENVAKGCRCLPRHIRSCPCANKPKHN
jgi:hypothetical protein